MYSEPVCPQAVKPKIMLKQSNRVLLFISHFVINFPMPPIIAPLIRKAIG
jgi:hypothetical protein